MFIDGFGVSGYRSFGSPIQRIGPFEKINLFVGQNNSGKSNILTFLTKHYSLSVKASQNLGRLKFEEIDRHRGQDDWSITVEFGLRIGSKRYNTLVNAKNLISGDLECICVFQRSRSPIPPEVDH